MGLAMGRILWQLLVIETTTAMGVAKMSQSLKAPQNNKSFRFVLIGQTFDHIDGKRYEKTNTQFAKPFGGGKAIKLRKDAYCKNVSK